ncbi:hypothetical protein ACIRSU_23005 [Streptomyces sp. NPDC101160]|uniref:hypothetical protein n=1 Tax=Streptomyces sp. NPDC101160 TaxID=3366118 RepID=UPI00380FCBCE
MTTECEAESAYDSAREAEAEAVWLVAANVVTWRRCGPGGQELRNGTKAFRGGAKVYVLKVHWGPFGDRLIVLGRERHTSRWIAVNLATRHLHNFRAKRVHSPRVLERLAESHYQRLDSADAAGEVAETLERYARRYRAEVAPRSPHPDHCLCHVCLTGEAHMADAAELSG